MPVLKLLYMNTNFSKIQSSLVIERILKLIIISVKQIGRNTETTPITAVSIDAGKPDFITARAEHCRSLSGSWYI